MSARQRVFKLAMAGLSASGAAHWLGRVTRGRGAVFMLHHVRPWTGDGFAPNRGLEVTPEFLDTALARIRRAGLAFVSMDEARERLLAGDDEPFAVLTLDDGYRNNRDHAAPVFRSHGCPYLIYCATDFLDGTGFLWWAVLEEAVRRLPVVPATIDGAEVQLRAGTSAEKSVAFDRIYWDLRAGAEARLLSGVRQLAERAGVDVAGLCRGLCLDWAELQAFAADPLLTVGAHTRSHPRLAKLSEDQARREMQGSRERLEAGLGRPVRHFAYPVGDQESAGPREFGLARDLGFATAVTTRPGHLFPEHRDHLTALPRVSLNGFHQEAGTVDLLVSGVPFALANRFRRVNVA